MNYETARANMIEQQIRPWNVLEMQTLQALNDVRREDFVPEQYRDFSFADIQISIANNEVMLEPKVGARMVEALGLTPDCRVLEIGAGTGYLTALMATMSAHVTSLEIDSELASTSRRNLAMAGINNTTIIEADCFSYSADKPFDCVLITGSTLDIGSSFLKMVSSGGRVVGIQGKDPAMQVVIINSTGAITTLFETSVPRLKNVEESVSFTF